MSFLASYLRLRVARITFFIYSLRQRVSDRIQIGILKRHDEYELIKTCQINSPQKVAIIALFPRPSILQSTIRLIDWFLKNNYLVVGVVNSGQKEESDWLKAFEGRDMILLRRPNLGRDFGAYRIGIKYLQERSYFSSMNELMIANDSMYYFPKSDDFLDDFSKNSSGWASFFVNYQYHLHAQSFFIRFTEKEFLSESFINFWNNYYPSNIRPVIIKMGEVELTNVLRNSGFSLNAYVTYRKIKTSQKFQGLKPVHKYAIWNTSAYWEVDKITNSEEVHDLEFDFLFTRFNPSHHAGLLASEVLSAPIKLDLLRGGYAPLGALMEIAAKLGVANDELRDFESAMTSQGSNASLTGLKKLWREFGFI
jgi:hypothetical protein